MKPPAPPAARDALATIIADALYLADELRLDLVGISLNGALERLTGHGIPVDPTGTSVH